MAEKPNNGPATAGLAHQRQAEAVRIVRDVLAGTLHLRRKKERYLPSFPKEPKDIYDARRAASVLFNATKRTLEAFAGMVFRDGHGLTLQEIHPQIEPHLDNVDLTGRDLDAFANAHFEDAQADGHACIFVDMQPPVEGAQSPLDEAGNRPYWIALRKQDIRAFETVNIGGVTALAGLRYHEVVIRKDGEWGETEVDRIREYRLADVAEEDMEPEVRVVWRVWELDPDKEFPGEEGDWALVDDGAMTRSSIPLAVTYTSRTGYLESAPPFLDLALENIKHYQTDSDNQNLARTAKVQTLVITGESEESVKSVAVGPGNAIVLENSEASADWIGADGSSFAVFLEDLDRIERRMAKMGLSMLATDQRANMSEGSKRIDKAESDSQLAGMAKGLERGLNDALRMHAEWVGVEEPGSIGVSTDFETEPLDSATFRELRELWGERGISWETLIKSMGRGELLPAGFDLEEERQRIAEEDGARLDAAERAVFGEDDREGDEDEGDLDAAA